jgi:pilus assembly protein FimV
LLLLHAGGAQALSLGRLTVQSSLGEALRAEIDITNMSPEEAASLRTTLASPDAFRAAGVEFNPVLSGAQLTLARRPDGRAYIRVSGDRAVSGPFVDVIIDFAWASGRLQRAYTLLIDPPATRTAPPPPAAATAPVITGAPAQATPIAPPPPSPPPVAPLSGPRPSRSRRRHPSRVHRRRQPRAPTPTAFAAATRCRRSPPRMAAAVSRSTRCWCRCIAAIRRRSSTTT